MPVYVVCMLVFGLFVIPFRERTVKPRHGHMSTGGKAPRKAPNQPAPPSSNEAQAYVASSFLPSSFPDALQDNEHNGPLRAHFDRGKGSPPARSAFVERCAGVSRLSISSFVVSSYFAAKEPSSFALAICRPGVGHRARHPTSPRRATGHGTSSIHLFVRRFLTSRRKTSVMGPRGHISTGGKAPRKAPEQPDQPSSSDAPV